jgi:hypothetical protein
MILARVIFLSLFAAFYVGFYVVGPLLSLH